MKKLFMTVDAAFNPCTEMINSNSKGEQFSFNVCMFIKASGLTYTVAKSIVLFQFWYSYTLVVNFEFEMRFEHQ